MILLSKNFPNRQCEPRQYIVAIKRTARIRHLRRLANVADAGRIRRIAIFSNRV
jgi:hypothetical protein